MTELRSLRMERGYTVTELALKCGIPAPTLFSYENGTRKLRKASFETILALAKVLRVKPEDLLGEEDLE